MISIQHLHHIIYKTGANFVKIWYMICWNPRAGVASVDWVSHFSSLSSFQSVSYLPRATFDKWKPKSPVGLAEAMDYLVKDRILRYAAGSKWLQIRKLNLMVQTESPSIRRFSQSLQLNYTGFVTQQNSWNESKWDRRGCILIIWTFEYRLRFTWLAEWGSLSRSYSNDRSRKLSE